MFFGAVTKLSKVFSCISVCRKGKIDMRINILPFRGPRCFLCKIFYNADVRQSGDSTAEEQLVEE